VTSSNSRLLKKYLKLPKSMEVRSREVTLETAEEAIFRFRFPTKKTADELDGR
jgi:hypothetical protein